MAKSLNELMEFDHVIKVSEDGAISDAPNVDSYNELYVMKDDNGNWQDEFSIAAGWELLKGFTGQYGYNGPVMHPSEFIGGGLERHIRETPGYYVALTVETDCGGTEDHCSVESGCECEPAGWAVAYKPLD